MVFLSLLQSTIDIRGNLAGLGTSVPVQTNLGTIIGSYIGAAILIGAIATLGYLVLGGVKWVTAGGDKGKVDKAREMITQAVVGLAVLASSVAIFMLIQFFFGIDLFGGTAGAGAGAGASSALGGGGGGGASGGGASGGGVNCQIGQVYNDGGSGGYCNGGAAMVKCVGPGVGPSGFPYKHYEPCGCVSGSQNPAYQFTSC